MAERGSPDPSWTDRIRRWLWLDRDQRTDSSQANRGLYPGGMPVYSGRKSVGRRFVLPVVALGVVIALVLILVRDSEARSCDGQVLAFEETGIAVCFTAEPPADRWRSMPSTMDV